MTVKTQTEKHMDKFKVSS